MSAAPSLATHILAALSRDKQPPRLRVSQAGSQCERAVYFAATGAEEDPEKPTSIVKMALGTAFDKYTLDVDYPAGQPGWRFQVPVEISIGGVTVKGTADAVFYDVHGKAVHCADLKTCGSKTIARIQKAPKQEHRAQCQLYAWGLGAATYSVCYVSADSGEILEHHGIVDEFEVQRDWGLFESVAYWMKRGEPPPRPYTDEEDDEGNITRRARDGFPCAWCRYRSTCWSAEKEKDESQEKPNPIENAVHRDGL